jgi:hypothetical protein
MCNAGLGGFLRLLGLPRGFLPWFDSERGTGTPNRSQVWTYVVPLAGVCPALLGIAMALRRRGSED